MECQVEGKEQRERPQNRLEITRYRKAQFLSYIVLKTA